jgi:hypothetical protein
MSRALGFTFPRLLLVRTDDPTLLSLLEDFAKPGFFAEAIRAKRDNDWNASGDIVSTPVHLGNISMTVKVRGTGNGGASEVNITFPESSTCPHRFNPQIEKSERLLTYWL